MILRNAFVMISYYQKIIVDSSLYCICIFIFSHNVGAHLRASIMSGRYDSNCKCLVTLYMTLAI